MMQFMYLDLVENILESWNWMLSPKLMLCSAMNDLSALLQDMAVVLLNPGVDQVAWQSYADLTTLTQVVVYPPIPS